MSVPAVEVVDVSKHYGGHVALASVSLRVNVGEYVVLLGPSGSGKTTLLSILGGFTEPSTGLVRIGGADVTRVAPARRPTVTVFQDYALFPHMTVEDNVAFGLEMRGVAKSNRRDKAGEALEVVGLSGFGKRRVHELSGGQRQRVALARAIVIQPTVLLLDEPLGALDVKIRRQMQDELHVLQRKLNATFIHVTHDQEEAMSIADRVVLLNKGRIEDTGPPERVYRRPSSLFAATFMGDTNILEGTVSTASPEAVAIETAFGRVSAKGDAKAGSRVKLSIRPESLMVHRPPGNSVSSLGHARLQEFVFQGTHRRCYACAPGTAGRLLLRLPADVASDSADVELWVRHSDVTIISEE